MVDEQQLCAIILIMIIEQIRKHIKSCGKSRYRISDDTGVDKAILSRIMQGGSCKVETADILLKHFGLKLTAVKKKQKGR